MENTQEKSYWNPYIVGTGIGLVIVLSYIVIGRGLGAVGAFSSFSSFVINAVMPDHAISNTMYSEYLNNDGIHPLKNWVVFEIIGICIGGFISGLLSKRIKIETIKGHNISSAKRFLFAFIGGILLGYAAKISRGCTSGLALSGGSVLSAGAWIFMLSVFIGGYSIAYLIRKLWN